MPVCSKRHYRAKFNPENCPAIVVKESRGGICKFRQCHHIKDDNNQLGFCYNHKSYTGDVFQQHIDQQCVISDIPFQEDKCPAQIVDRISQDGRCHIRQCTNKFNPKRKDGLCSTIHAVVKRKHGLVTFYNQGKEQFPEEEQEEEVEQQQEEEPIVEQEPASPVKKPRKEQKQSSSIPSPSSDNNSNQEQQDLKIKGMSRLEEELKTLHQNNLQYQAELERLSKQLQKVNSSPPSPSTSKNNIKFQQALDQTQVTLEETKATLKICESNNDKRQSLVDALEIKLTEKTTNFTLLQERIDQLTKELAAVKQTKASSSPVKKQQDNEQQESKLTEILSRTQIALEETKIALNHCQSNKEQLIHQLESKTNELHHVEQQLHELTTDLNHRKQLSPQKRQDDEAKEKNLRVIFQQMKVEIQETKAKLSSCQSSQQEKQSTIQLLQSKITIHNQQIIYLQQQLKQVKDELNNRKQLSPVHRQKLEKHEAELKVLFKNMEEELHKSNTALKTCQSSLTSCSKSDEKRKLENYQQAAQLIKLQEQIQKLRNDLSQTDKVKSERNHQLEQTLDQVKQTLNICQRENKEHHNTIATLQKDIQIKIQELITCKNELAAMKEEVSHHKRSSSIKLQQQVDNKENEFNQKIQELNDALTQLQTELQSKEISLKACETSNEKQHVDITLLKADNQAKHLQLVQLNQHLKQCNDTLIQANPEKTNQILTKTQTLLKTCEVDTENQRRVIEILQKQLKEGSDTQYIQTLRTLERANADLLVVTKTNHELNNQFTTLQKQYQNLENENRQNREQGNLSQHLHATIQHLVSKLATCESDRNQYNQKLASQRDEYNQQLFHLQSQLKDMGKIVDHKQSNDETKLAKLDEQVKLAQQQLHKYQIEAQKLQAANQAIEVKHAKQTSLLQEEFNKLQHQLGVTQEKNNDLQIARKACETELLTCKEQKQHQFQSIQQSQKELTSQHSNVVNKLQTQLQEAQQHIHKCQEDQKISLHQQQVAYHEKLTALQEQLASSVNNRKSMDSDALQQAKKQLKECDQAKHSIQKKLAEELKQKTDNYNQILEEFQQYKTATKELKHIHNAYRQKTEQTLEKVKAKENQCGQLTETLAKHEVQLKEVQLKLQDQMAKSTELHHELLTKNQQLVQHENKSKALTDELVKLKQSIHQEHVNKEHVCQKDLQTLTKQYETLQADNDDFKQSEVEFKQEIDRLRTELATHHDKDKQLISQKEDEIRQSHLELNHCSEKLNKTTMSLNNLLKRHEENEIKLPACQEQLKTLSKTIHQLEQVIIPKLREELNQSKQGIQLCEKDRHGWQEKNKSCQSGLTLLSKKNEQVGQRLNDCIQQTTNHQNQQKDLQELKKKYDQLYKVKQEYDVFKTQEHDRIEELLRKEKLNCDGRLTKVEQDYQGHIKESHHKQSKETEAQLHGLKQSLAQEKVDCDTQVSKLKRVIESLEDQLRKVEHSNKKNGNGREEEEQEQEPGLEEQPGLSSEDEKQVFTAADVTKLKAMLVELQAEKEKQIKLLDENAIHWRKAKQRIFNKLRLSNNIQAYRNIRGQIDTILKFLKQPMLLPEKKELSPYTYDKLTEFVSTKS